MPEFIEFMDVIRKKDEKRGHKIAKELPKHQAVVSGGSGRMHSIKAIQVGKKRATIKAANRGSRSNRRSSSAEKKLTGRIKNK
jgi:hypothetical protein